MFQIKCVSRSGSNGITNTVKRDMDALSNMTQPNPPIQTIQCVKIKQISFNKSRLGIKTHNHMFFPWVLYIIKSKEKHWSFTCGFFILCIDPKCSQKLSVMLYSYNDNHYWDCCLGHYHCTFEYAVLVDFSHRYLIYKWVIIISQWWEGTRT